MFCLLVPQPDGNIPEPQTSQGEMYRPPDPGKLYKALHYRYRLIPSETLGELKTDLRFLTFRFSWYSGKMNAQWLAKN